MLIRPMCRTPLVELLLPLLWLSLSLTNVTDAQTGLSQSPPRSIEGATNGASPAYGAGVMVSGELWDSFLPQNVGPYYGEATQPVFRVFVRMGNFDRLWSHPTHIWPGGFNLTAFWAKSFLLAEYNPDPTFNPATVGGSSNPSFDPASGSHYALAAYPNRTMGRTIPGAGNPSRDYSIETHWVDNARRYAAYEAAWPTNLGIDVRMKVHQWSLNWNSFNDFLIVEFQLTNTGNVDINCDGIVERPGNVIQALTMWAGGEVAMSALMNTAGTRSSHFTSGRHSGYVGDPDPSGSPWDIVAVYPGEASPGSGSFGLNSGSLRYYTDIWSAWTWLGVKQGADPTGADKQTIFGTHPVGQGAQRGWYSSAGSVRTIGNASRRAKHVHTTSMGAWYTDGGKQGDTLMFNLAPNPNFFQSGTAGDPTTFVPKASPGRPNGDRKLRSEEIGGAAFEVAKFEDAWTRGYNSQGNFDGDVFGGIGPFRMEVGETMTIYWAEASGYRLQGVANAIAAARWTLQNGLVVPDSPPTPQMRVTRPRDTPFRVHWDNGAESDADFAGYKIYRTSSIDSIDWVKGGMRSADEYWRTVVPGPAPPALLKPVNPNFSAYSLVEGVRGIPDSWGPYELVAVIPAEEKAQYAEAALPGYQYAWDDDSAALGPSYWYYVAAYAVGDHELGPSWVSFPGTNPSTADTIESPNINRNGASGLWEFTYPFAYRNAYFPRDPDGLRRIGAPVRRDPLLANHQVSFGTVSVGASSDRSIQLVNSFDEAVTITIASSSALFSVLREQLELEPGETFELACRYSPASVTSDTGMILFSWDAIPYADTVLVTGNGSGSGYFAVPVWDVFGPSWTNIYTSFSLECDDAGNVYSAGTRMGPPTNLDLEKRSAIGGLSWTANEQPEGSLPMVAGIHVNSMNETFVLISNHPAQLYKFSSSGVRQWKWESSVRGLQGNALDMAMDTAGNFYVTGYVLWTYFNTRIFVAKVDPQGQEQWISLYDFAETPQDSDDIARAIAIDAGGRLAVVGATGHSFGEDIVVLRCDQNGVMEWHDILDLGGSRDEGNDIAIDDDGTILITGNTQAGPQPFALTAAYRPDGTRKWIRIYPDDPQGSASAARLAVDAEGGVYVVGSILRGNAPADNDYLTLRYDRDGILTWVRTYDGPVGGSDGARLIAIDDQNDVYVAGTSLGSTENNEIATVKYSGLTGETIWETRYDRLTGLSATTLIVDRQGNVVVGGTGHDGSSHRTVIVKYGQLATSAIGTGEGIPSEWTLHQNYPNPFNPTTTIGFTLPKAGPVRLIVYDLLGQEIAVLVDKAFPAGTFKTVWDATGLASGVYLYRLTAGEYVRTKKAVLIK